MTLKALQAAAAIAKDGRLANAYLKKAAHLAINNPDRPEAPDFGPDLSGQVCVAPVAPRRRPITFLPWIAAGMVAALFLNDILPNWS